ncbi:MAG TPA: helix-turn-helix domain-containing protein [Solirubrobacter sp.]
MSALADRAVTDVRKIHLEMIDAVLAGGGVAPVAVIAAEHLGGSVAIVLEDVAVVEPPLPDGHRPRVVTEIPIRSGDETLGSVRLLDAADPDDAEEVLELAAVAALTALTLRDASVTKRRASAVFFDELRGAQPLTGAEIVARARGLDADLSRGASALSVRAAGRVDRVLATIAQEYPGALAAPREDRVEALLPAPREGDPSLAARRLARRLNTTGLSPFEPDAAALSDALRVAELSGGLNGVDLDALLGGSWRLLLASSAAQRQALIDATVGPARALVDTLRAYLAHDANMNATANVIYAHRHTVSSRLERIRALTGHDPQTTLGQTQLALGLQALDIERAAAEYVKDDRNT